MASPQGDFKKRLAPAAQRRRRKTFSLSCPVIRTVVCEGFLRKEEEVFILSSPFFIFPYTQLNIHSLHTQTQSSAKWTIDLNRRAQTFLQTFILL